MAAQILLPVNVTSKTDVIRLQREVELIDDFFLRSKVRKSGETLQPPKTSQLLDSTAHVNDLNLLQDADREKLTSELKQVVTKAPVLHISFASSPGQKFMERLVAWFRQEIHPNALLDIGLQPSIAAGCTLRTTSKYFDFSLRKHLAEKKPELLEKMRSTT